MLNSNLSKRRKWFKKKTFETEWRSRNLQICNLRIYHTNLQICGLAQKTKKFADLRYRTSKRIVFLQFVDFAAGVNYIGGKFATSIKLTLLIDNGNNIRLLTT
jgi:hypothetical protein